MLKRYLHRLYDTIISRGDLDIELLVFDDQSGVRGTIEGRLRFHDGSLLEFDEIVVIRVRKLVKIRYAYHYQNARGEMEFRYDNAPHHPEVVTYPDHKHVGDQVVSSNVPDLSDMLREIDSIIYAR